MDTYRFFVPDLLAQAAPEKGGEDGKIVHLPDDQERHARQVLRLEAGQIVELFDGKGAWAKGKVAGATRGRGGQIAVAAEAVERDMPSAVQLTLATAVPKGDRAEWLVEQASQLDVAAIQWLECDRGVVKPREGGQKMEKWRRIAVESAKQCGRNFLLEIHEPVTLDTALKNVDGASRVLWLEPRAGGMNVHQAMAEKSGRAGAAGGVVALVGPEGGWSPREWDVLEAAVKAGRAERVRLTRSTLRIETACAAMAAVVMSG